MRGNKRVTKDDFVERDKIDVNKKNKSKLETDL